MTGKVLRVLYLEKDYFAYLGSKKLGDLGGVVLEVVPEEVNLKDRDLADWLPKNIRILEDQALNKIGHHDSLYFPTPEVLDQIQRLTERGEFDIVLIANNMGAGVKKAQRVAQPLRAHSIIFGHSSPASLEYRQLGYSRFTTRLQLADELLRLIQELVG